MDVQIRGNKLLPLNKILPQIHTRKGRPFDLELIQEDVKRLDRTHLFVSVRTYYQQVAGGRIVIFDVVERPLLKEIRILGCQEVHVKVLKKELEKECHLKEGDALDPMVIEESRRHLEEFYHTKGYNGAQVTLLEGDKPGDSRAVFIVDEGTKQRVLSVNFIGNTIADDGRLQTQIKTSHPILWLFKGEYDRKQLEEDKARLTAYYRGLGYFHARIGVEPNDNDPGKWVTITFVIDEGIRFKIRDVTVLGNKKYSNAELMADLKLKKGDYFNEAQLNADKNSITDKYGGVGYAFAKVEPDPRFLEQEGQLDLIYKIQEGDRYRVGKINVKIKGEYPHTQIATVLNRLSFRPGDVVDIREIRSSERRLRLSQLFEANPAQGNAPKIAFSPPGSEAQDDDDDAKPGPKDGSRGQRGRGMGRGMGPGMGSGMGGDQAGDGTFRGQSPDSDACDRVIDVTMGEGPNVITLDRSGYSVAPDQSVAPPAQPSLGQSLDRARLILTQQYVPNVPDASQPAPAPQRPALQWSSGAPAAAAPVSAAPPVSYPPPNATVPAASYPPPQYLAQQPPPATSGQMYSQSGVVQPGPSQLIPVQAAPVQPAPAYGQPWPSQAPQRPVDSPQGPYVPGSIFSEGSPFRDGPPDGGEMLQPLPFSVLAQEAMTGRLMFGVGVNSDAGLVGSITLDEQNFDWTRFPTSWEDVRNGTAFRGGGERLRLEAMPGTQLQRYMIDFTEPYAFGAPVSLGLSGYYYTRVYNEYTDQRLGGRVALGYLFSPDLSGGVAYRGAKVNITNPIDPLLPALAEVTGRDLALHEFQLSLTNDKRDNAYMATEGHLIQFSVAEVLGSFQYPHAEIDLRKYFTLYERPDHSGRQVLTLAARAGITGDNTPIYERYYAGGFSTIRGFAFRGVSPQQIGPSTEEEINVGGDFMMLASAEYLFPITADDMLRGVIFCDTGTVEPTINNWTNRYRVAPGFGLRIMVPAMGPRRLRWTLPSPFPGTRATPTNCSASSWASTARRRKRGQAPSPRTLFCGTKLDRGDGASPHFRGGSPLNRT